MSSHRAAHRAPRRPFQRALRSRSLRFALSLGVIGGIGATGTLAYWTDSSVLTTGSFTSGTMDLQLDTGAVGLNTAYAKTSITWSGLSPNERKAFNLAVKNVGNPSFTWRATATRGTSPAWTYVGSPITVQVYSGSAVADTTFPQQDSCTGSALGDAVAVDGTNRALVTAAQAVTAGSTQNVCVVVGLDVNADNGNQNKTGSLSLAFAADQVTS